MTDDPVKLLLFYEQNKDKIAEYANTRLAHERKMLFDYLRTDLNKVGLGNIWVAEVIEMYHA